MNNEFKRDLWRVALTMWVSSSFLMPVVLHADQAGKDQQQSTIVQHLYVSPEEAIQALLSAAAVNDQDALRGIFGPGLKELLTGDKVEDAANTKKFALAMANGYALQKDGDDRVTIELGEDHWPMPIPLRMVNGYWLFDTAAGKEEIINRHIGKDELYAISICHAYVIAQQEYARLGPQTGQGGSYARKFKSSAGKKDGLYWPVTGNETASPFGALVAQAAAEGYHALKGRSPRPFHGYFFRILTRQGKSAPGGVMDYMSRGHLSRGYALIAYPVLWGRSGIMTFIVDQDGHVYQQDLGAATLKIASGIREYDPDSRWSLVQDQGVVSEAQSQ